MRARTLAVGAVVAVGLTGCAPQINNAGCGKPDPAVLTQIQQSVRAEGELRNARTYTPAGSPWTFVSIERRTKLNISENKPGNILTFAVHGNDVSDLVAVDQRARKDSDVTDAPFDVRKPGAIQSRGCVYNAFT